MYFCLQNSIKTNTLMSNIKDKVVWITGASSGIGEALVYACDNEGAKIILSSRNEKELKRVLEKCTNRHLHMLLPFDLGSLDNISLAVGRAIEVHKRIDILINNGGVSQRVYATDAELSLDRKIMEVNFFGTVALTKCVLPFMIDQGGGKIIIVSSIAGKFGFYLRSAYAASKHALHGFFESLRLELAEKNIKIMLVCPGKVKTNISLNAYTSESETHGKMDEAHTKGISPESCAQQILSGIKRDKLEIYVGNFDGRFALWMKRFFPTVFYHLLKKQKVE